jgi:hypothetical protein
VITLDTLTISDNMVLTGIIEASQVVYEQERTVEGVSKVTISPKVGGRPLTLGSDTSGGSTMGVWCQATIEGVKDLELTRTPKVLDYNGAIFYVYIVDTSDFTPLFKWEPESPTKKYIGTIKMIEA